MNRIVFSLLLALCTAPDQASPSFDKLRFIRESKCLEKESLTMNEVLAYTLEGKLEEAESKPELHCFAACLFDFSGAMRNCDVRDEYYIGIDMFKELYQVLVACKGRVDSADRCECARQLSECMVEQKRLPFGDN